jgi:hypothetical protein
MAITMTTEELKQAIAALSAVKQTRRYPAHLRAEVLRHARARISAGASRAAVCEELDVSEPTLMRFLDGDKPRANFARVRIVEQRATAKRTLTVKGPCGIVVEGLTMTEVAELLRKASCSA